MSETPDEISAQIAGVLNRTVNHTPVDRRWALNDHLKGFRAVDLQAFLAANGIRFTGKPKRAEIIAEILDIYAPEEN